MSQDQMRSQNEIHNVNELIATHIIDKRNAIVGREESEDCSLNIFLL